MSRDHGFEQRMRKRLEQAGCYVLKLADAPAPFIGRPELEGSEARFTNPFDFVVLDEDGRGAFYAYALELKSTAAPRFALNTVQDHQQSGLRNFPGKAGVVVEIRKEARCFFVVDGTLLARERWAGKKSMNLTDLEGHAVELPRNTSGRERLDYYDVGPLLGTGQGPEQVRIPDCV